MKGEEKQAAVGGTEVEVQVQGKPVYPPNLLTVYANSMGVLALQDEIYLDALQIQPQTLDNGTALATAVARVVISKPHARRLVEALQRVLKAGTA